MATKSKEAVIPKVYMQDIVEALSSIGAHWPLYSTHEIVFPPCMVENPNYKPPESDVQGLSLDTSTFYEYLPIQKIAGRATLFGYDTRYDSAATEVAILPKQVDPPLLFEGGNNG